MQALAVVIVYRERLGDPSCHEPIGRARAAMLRSIRQTKIAQNGPDDPQVHWCTIVHAVNLPPNDAVVAQCRAAVGRLEHILGPNHFWTASANAFFSVVLRLQGGAHDEEWERVSRVCFKSREAVFGPEDVWFLHASFGLVACLLQRGGPERFAEAIRIVRRAAAVAQRNTET
eukprot:gene48342-56917_t